MATDSNLPPATSQPGRRLVLCADDYGMNSAVTEAVLRLVRAGRGSDQAETGGLGATSAMVLSPRWREDSRPLSELRGLLDVGLHLDWTSEFALAAGHGMSLGAAMRHALFGGFDQTAARMVIERQLDAFEAAWEAPPDHIDGHQHVQQFAGIRQALVEVVARRYGARAPWLRVSRPPGRLDVKGQIIAALGANALTSSAVRAGLPVSRILSGIYGFDARAGVYARHMAQWLVQAPEGALLMCHPATQAEAGDEIGPARVREFEFLGSPAFADQLRSSGVRLVRGSALYGVSGVRPGA